MGFLNFFSVPEAYLIHLSYRCWFLHCSVQRAVWVGGGRAPLPLSPHRCAADVFVWVGRGGGGKRDEVNLLCTAHHTSPLRNIQDRIQNTEYKLRNTEHRIQNTDYGIQNTEYRIQTTEYRTQNTEYKLRNTEHRIQNTNYGIQNTEYKIQNKEYRNWCTQDFQCTCFFIWSLYLMIWMGANPIRGPLEGVDPEN